MRMIKTLTIDIEDCKDCTYAGLRYKNPSMNYRNQCEHPKSKDVHIYNGTNIPDKCPLPDSTSN